MTTYTGRRAMPRGWRATARAVWRSHGKVASSHDIKYVMRVIWIFGMAPIEASEYVLSPRLRMDRWRKVLNRVGKMLNSFNRELTVCLERCAALSAIVLAGDVEE